ncbi:MAG: hypothetical protein JSS07_01130 [Proteobacteria bacterium]|nr:hypothetical protein [Pseudomonadota bacterium]
MNYLSQHWHGNHSLPRSFWLNWLLIPAAMNLVYLIFFLSFVLVHYLYKLSAPSTLALSVALLPLVPICVFQLIWGNVGLWRSTRRYSAKTQKRLWSCLVQIIIVFNVGYFMYDIYTLGTSNLSKVFSINENPQILKNQNYDLFVNSEKNYLHIQGDFNTGLADSVEQIIKENPKINTIVLDSNGGLVVEGIKISKIIQEHHLNTASSEKCYSACTIAFISGKNRILTKKAQLAFHKSSLPEEQESYIPELHRLLEKYYLEKKIYPLCRKQGINEDFIEKFKKTSAEQLWFPTTQEMLDMGLVHQLSDFM